MKKYILLAIIIACSNYAMDKDTSAPPSNIIPNSTEDWVTYEGYTLTPRSQARFVSNPQLRSQHCERGILGFRNNLQANDLHLEESSQKRLEENIAYVVRSMNRFTQMAATTKNSDTKNNTKD